MQLSGSSYAESCITNVLLRVAFWLRYYDARFEQEMSNTELWSVDSSQCLHNFRLFTSFGVTRLTHCQRTYDFMNHKQVKTYLMGPVTKRNLKLRK